MSNYKVIDHDCSKQDKVYLSSVTRTLVDKCKKYIKADTDKIPANQYLVGHIKQEYIVSDEHILNHIKDELIFHLMTFLDVPVNDIIYDETDGVVGVWYNVMEKGEFNPPHCHAGTSQWSFVLYIDIPQFVGDGEDQPIGGRQDGSIGFVSSSYPGQTYIHHPKAGDLAIFNSMHTHYVNPFKCEGNRISIAGNIRGIII